MRTNLDKYHPGYFGKVGMRHFHLNSAQKFDNVINLDKLWSLVPVEQREKALSKKSDTVPLIDLRALGYTKLLGKGRLPEAAFVVRTRLITELAEKKITKAGGLIELVA